MMTKSLHTITAVKRVAEHLRAERAYPNAEYLTISALAVLGYEYTVAQLKTDETLARCLAAVGGK